MILIMSRLRHQQSKLLNNGGKFFVTIDLFVQVFFFFSCCNALVLNWVVHSRVILYDSCNSTDKYKTLNGLEICPLQILACLTSRTAVHFFLTGMGCYPSVVWGRSRVNLAGTWRLCEGAVSGIPGAMHLWDLAHAVGSIRVCLFIMFY